MIMRDSRVVSLIRKMTWSCNVFHTLNAICVYRSCTSHICTWLCVSRLLWSFSIVVIQTCLACKTGVRFPRDHFFNFMVKLIAERQSILCVREVSNLDQVCHYFMDRQILSDISASTARWVSGFPPRSGLSASIFRF